MSKPVALTPTYGGLSGNVAMSQLDGTYGQIQTAFNDLSTYGVYVTDTGAVNALVVTTAPLTLTLSTGVALDILIANTNTGACTLNVNGTGPVTVTDGSGAALGANTLITNTLYHLVYDGTNWRASGTAAGGGVGPGSFTTLTASAAVSGAGFTSLFAAPPALGGTTPAAGTHTTLSVTGTSTLTGSVAAKNVVITPTTGLGLSVKSASNSHSTQIADAANTSYNAGYLGTPTSASTTLALVDRGKTVITVAGTVTIPNSLFAAGDVVCIYNHSTSNASVAAASGVTLYIAGTNTGGVATPRVLGVRGIATLFFYTASYVLISGAGVT